MKVKIAFVTGPDGQVDKGRVGTVEDWPDAEARRLIKEGIAVAATDADIEDHEARQAYLRGVAEAERASAAATVMGARADRDADSGASAVAEPAGPVKARRSGAAVAGTATGDPADPDSGP